MLADLECSSAPVLLYWKVFQSMKLVILALQKELNNQF